METNVKQLGRPATFDRERAIMAATNLYWSSGVAKTSFNEVARALNVSKPTLYRYFGDEDGLLSEALSSYCDQHSMHPELLCKTGDLRTDLNAWFDAQIDALYARHEDDTVPSGCLLMECVQLGKALGEKTTAMVNQCVRGLLDMFEDRLKMAEEQQQLRDGVDVGAAVHLIAGQTIVAKNVVLIGEPKENLKRMVRLAIDGIAV